MSKLCAVTPFFVKVVCCDPFFCQSVLFTSWLRSSLHWVHGLGKQKIVSDWCRELKFKKIYLKNFSDLKQSFCGKVRHFADFLNDCFYACEIEISNKMGSQSFWHWHWDKSVKKGRLLQNFFGMHSEVLGILILWCKPLHLTNWQIK